MKRSKPTSHHFKPSPSWRATSAPSASCAEHPISIHTLLAKSNWLERSSWLG
jgi:hypothetical protein